jgi:type VI secretion system secreted protein Hcp
MAVDMFLKLDGIKGESKDKDHKDEIAVLAWSWGISQSGTTHIGSGGGSGKASFQDISVTKWVDISTPALMTTCATGKHLKDAVLIVRKAGETPLEYIKITMKECIITSISTGGSGGDDMLTENISINFAEVNFVYVTQSGTGSGGGNLPFNYNIAENHV